MRKLSLNMNYLSHLLLNFILSFRVLTGEDICSAIGMPLVDAFRWKQDIYLLTQNTQNYRIKDFKWDSTGEQFSIGAKEQISWNWTTGVFVTFAINYPNKGLRVFAGKPGKVDNIDQMVGQIIDLDDSGSFKSANDININPYKWNSPMERLQLGQLLQKLPDESLSTQLKSLSPFPSNVASLSQRFFVYYEEIPPKIRPNVCQPPNPCVKPKRLIFVAKQIAYTDQIKDTNWFIDNTTDHRCDDMKDVRVIASLALTDYTSDPKGFRFDWIEFFGTQYNVIRVSISTDDKVVDISKVKTDSIRSLFQCEDKTTTVSSPDTTQPGSSAEETAKTEQTDESGGSISTDGNGGTQTEGAGDGQTKGPGDGQSEGPGDGQTKAPGDGQSEGPGDGQTKDPDYDGTKGPEEDSSKPTEKSSSGGFPWLFVILLLLFFIVVTAVIVWFIFSKKGKSISSGVESAPPPQPVLASGPPPSAGAPPTGDTSTGGKADISGAEGPTPVETTTDVQPSQ